MILQTIVGRGGWVESHFQIIFILTHLTYLIQVNCDQYFASGSGSQFNMSQPLLTEVPSSLKQLSRSYLIYRVFLKKSVFKLFIQLKIVLCASSRRWYQSHKFGRVVDEIFLFIIIQCTFIQLSKKSYNKVMRGAS